MKTSSCLTFHDFFEYINDRLTSEQAGLVLRHLETCSRCQGELQFIRKVNQAIGSRHQNPANLINRQLNQPHITEEIQEQYFQGTFSRRAKDAVYKHLAVCDDCLQEFMEMARVSIPELNNEEKAFFAEVESAYVPDRLAAYRSYFMTPQPSLLAPFLKFKNWIHGHLAPVPIGRLAFVAVGVLVAAVISYLPIRNQLIVSGAIKSGADFIKAKIVSDGEVRLTGGVQFEYRPKSQAEKAITLDTNPLLRALEIRPNNSELNHQIGTFYFFNGEMQLAEEHYRRALAYDNNNAEIYNDLALIYFDRKDYSQALDHLEKAISFDPKLLEAYYNKAIILEVKKDTEKAIAAWNEYIDKDQAQPDSDWKSVAIEHRDALSK